MSKAKLPIGIQTFAAIRNEGYAYVDKSRFIASLAEGKYYFLSRPRRFGKSLLIDTLDCAFSGRRELFKGLFLDKVESGWDWDKRHSVIRIGFGSGSVRTPADLNNYARRRLAEEGAKLGFETLQDQSAYETLRDLVHRVHERDGVGAVVLIDEYDKPILDNIENPAVAVAMREELKSLYSVLKDCDPWLRFVFLTGVSKFAKAGIFSGLNNLNDITVDARYSAICGYTQADLETVFADRLEGFDKAAVREWYNGYAWLGEAVYNPFDILLLFDKGSYRPWWFETGTPAFLVKLLAQKPRTLPDLDGLDAGEELLGSFDIENLRPETLLFQAGYLTIKAWSSDSDEGTKYRLGFPNREVRAAFSQSLLDVLRGSESPPVDRRLRSALEANDADTLRAVIHSFFASIPNDWYRKNRLSEFEGYYASVVYACFASVGYEVIPEDVTNRGRIDLTVKTRSGIWIFEFKVKGLDHSGEKKPLAQLRERGYAQKYRADGRPLRQVGIVFDPESRNIEGWETEQV